MIADRRGGRDKREKRGEAGSASAKRTVAQKRHSRAIRLRQFLTTAASNGRLPAFMLSAGLSVFVVGFLVSDEFSVHTVVVEGNNVAYADSIVIASDALGQPIFRLDTDDVARRVAAHPAVASAEVRAEFPNRIVVNLRERIPVLSWQVADRSVLIDEHGWVISEGVDDTLPVIVQEDGVLPSPGQKVPVEFVQTAQIVVAELGEELTMLEYDLVSGLTVHLSDGRSVEFGEIDRIPLKLAVVDAVLDQSEPWTELDVREPDRPYYR